MGTTIRYILLTAVRDWLYIGIFGLLFLAIGAASFLGSTALSEQGEMTIAYVGGASRIVILVGLIVFVCFHIRRAFENREIEVMLTRPISRGQFVFSYWLGFAIVSLAMILVLLLLMYFLLPVKLSSLLYWGLSLMFEAFFVVAFAVFASLILKSAVIPVLLTFAFYVISRMMGFFLYIIDRPGMPGILEMPEISINALMNKALFLFSMILPRLDFFSKTDWLVYGLEHDTSYFVFIPQTLIYVPMLLLAAIYDFKRKQF